jgi:uracil-DNA glycosylase
MSANFGGWFGNKHFSQANNYLRSRGLPEIEW